MTWVFMFFFVSGFCSILCELIWLRLSMAQFGVTTALTSIVVSVFMTGLGAGSWFGGTLMRRYGDRVRFPVLRLYALLELMIGLSALAVPTELIWGHRLLERLADRAALASAAYNSISGLCLAATMIPWCACMGATIPVAMFAIRTRQRESDSRSFSFLYLANVLGAVLGSFLPLLLIELYGFHKTLRIGAILNVAIAISAFAMSIVSRPAQPRASMIVLAREWPNRQPYRPIAFVIHHRTSHHGHGVDLDSTLHPLCRPNGLFLWHDPGGLPFWLPIVGSQIYRYWSRRYRTPQENRLTWVSLALLGMLPLLTADLPRSPCTWWRGSSLASCPLRE